MENLKKMREYCRNFLNRLRWCVQTFLTIFPFIVAFFAIIGIFFAVWNLYDIWGDDTSAKLMHSKLTTMNRKETITFIGWGMSGLFAILGLIVLNKRANAQQATAEAQKMTAEAQMQSAEVQIQNNEFAKQQYVDEKYEDAIQNLGHKHAGVRIAAYYSLHRLAKTYKNLREGIFTQLCTHLRDITTAPDYAGKTKPTEGVQTLLDILFKSEDSKIIFRGLKANLQRVRLPRADLVAAFLPNTNFRGADLRGADFTLANLRLADFANTKMHGALLRSAQAQRINLYAAQLLGANFDKAQMQLASLEIADARGTNWSVTELQAADLSRTDLRGAMFQHARLQDADLFAANLGGAFDCWASGNFKINIKNHIGRPGDLSTCIRRGNMHSDDVEKTAKILPDALADYFRDRMQKHSGHVEYGLTQEEINDQDIHIDPYSQEQADEWIAEYKEAMGDISDNQK